MAAGTRKVSTFAAMPALWLHSEMQGGKGSGVGVPLWICLNIRMATPVHNDALWCLFWTQIYDYFLYI